MDAATAALAATPAYATPAPYNVPAPARAADTSNVASQNNFQDLVTANLKTDEQSNDAQAADDNKRELDATKTASAAAAPGPTASTAPKSKSAKADTAPVTASATTPAVFTPSIVTPLDPALNKQVTALVSKVFGGSAQSGATSTLNKPAQKKLTQTIDTLLAGLPVDQRQTALSALQTMLTQGGGAALTTTGTAAAQSGAAALIAAGLTPQQLTGLANTLNNLLAAPAGIAGAQPLSPAAPDDGDNGDAITAADLSADATTTATPAVTESAVPVPATLQLIAPALKRDPIFAVRPAPVPQGKNTQAATTPTAVKSAGKNAASDIAAQLNALTNTDDAGQPGERAAHPIDSVFQIFAQSQTGGTATATPATATTTATAAAKSAATILLANATATLAAAASNTTSSTSTQTSPDAGSFASQLSAASGLSSAALGATPLLGSAMMTSLVTNAATAGAAHPATQAVATAVMQAGDDGEDSNITVSLDPAELGKVEVRLQIGKDQSVKAHLVVEKPETYLMLQRDQHVLQKSLQDSGLDANSGALSFELAQGGMNFSQDNREGNASQGGTGSSDKNTSVGTVLETTMTWSVDPQNGLTHYNLLA